MNKRLIEIDIGEKTFEYYTFGFLKYSIYIVGCLLKRGLTSAPYLEVREST